MEWFRCLSTGLIYYYLTSVIAIAGIYFGDELLIVQKYRAGERNTQLEPFSAMDGTWYKQIAEGGYRFEPQRRCNVAFFPGYPLAARALSYLTGLPPEIALIAVAHLALAGAFALAVAYLRQRMAKHNEEFTAAAMLAMGLIPTGAFFRMTYSESLFLLLVIGFLYGVQNRWPLLVLALIAGTATGVRSVGVAMLVPTLLAVWQRTGESVLGESKKGLRLIRRLGASIAILPLCLWGLFAFMGYLAIRFGEPLAFAQVQQHWQLRPVVPLSEKAWALATLEPIWSVYVPSSPCYWERFDKVSWPFSLYFANPIYYVCTVGLIGFGAWRGWLNATEILLSGGLLLIPYVTRSHEMCMGSAGRFAAVVFPTYLVLARLLAAVSWGVRCAFLAISAALMFVYSAMFAAGYGVF